MAVAKKGKRKVSAADSAEARARGRHKRKIRAIFETAGFTRFPAVSDRHFQFRTAKTDFDDCFAWKNVVVLVEYTSDKDVSSHFKSKSYCYQEFIDYADTFVEFLRTTFPDIKLQLQQYDTSQVEVRFLYCSLREISGDLLDRMRNVSVFSEVNRTYFSFVAKAVRHSARNEILDFLEVPFERAGEAVTNAAIQSITLPAQFIPSSASYLAADHLVVTFYARPSHLLSVAYVLRRQGWRDQEYLFQRMIDKAKVDSIRDHLLENRRVFLNNIVVALPSTAILKDAVGKTIDGSKIGKLTEGTITLQSRFNSVGIIDGQHRVFSYHEGGKDDAQMQILRDRQDLLITGVVFPEDLTEADKLKVQADIFLEINSKQTSAKSELIQDLSVLISPYSEISVAKQVLNKLNQNGPLTGLFARNIADAGRLKTASVVSYGLRQAIKYEGDDTLFRDWNGGQKELLPDAAVGAPLDEYTSYCAKHVAIVFSAVKANIPDRWDYARSETNGVLNTTFVNGVLVLLRHMIREGKSTDFESMKKEFAAIRGFPFETFKSSQYGKMGRQLFERVFP